MEPASLPMLCEPLKWSKDNYGGYLQNEIIKSDLITGSKHHNHNMDNKDNLYKAINYMSSVKLSFNEDLLNYLLNDGKFLFNNSESLTESELYQMHIQLNVAQTYLNVPIYVPLQADWRGRIYTKSFFANYQGDDLSLSLIEFWEGEPLSESGLKNLYIHGANIYNDNNISKDTYENRIKWVKDNYNKIL